MSWMDMTHAVLPHAALLPLWVKLSWALVVSAVVLRVIGRMLFAARVAVWGAAMVLALMLLPGVDRLSGYLALAFQTPSLVLVAWALWTWVDALQRRQPVQTMPNAVACLGVLLGWALVLDTLNYWPAFFNPQLYAFGFESAGLWSALAVLAAVLWWAQVALRWVLSVVAVLAVYVLLRLPTGNVWDALIDPFVWLALHVQVWRAWRSTNIHARTSRARGFANS